MNQGQSLGRGMGRGMGMGGGRGRGGGRGMGRGMGMGRAPEETGLMNPSKEQELRLLKEQAADLVTQMEALQAQIKGLEKED